MLTFFYDLRFAVRQLRRHPGLTAAVVLILAIGIGASVAMFSIFSAALLRPLPYSHADRLVMLWETKRQYAASYQADRITVAAANFGDWRTRNRVFNQMSLVEGAQFEMGGSGATEKVTALQVQPGFFDLLGSHAAIGRTFPFQQENSSSDNGVVLSWDLWQRTFGAQTKLAGQAIHLNGRLFTVIGMMPPDFTFPVAKWDLWVPLAIDAKQWAEREGHSYGVIARLRDNVSLNRAQSEMSAIAADLERQYPATNAGSGIRLVRINDEVIGSVRPALIAILSAVGLLLVIVCSNVAMLLLSRAAGRRQEIAIRVALGANRQKLLRQLLTESLLFAGIGGALGFALGSLSLSFLRAMPIDLPRLAQASIDWRVVAFALLVVGASTALFGLAPAWQLALSKNAASLESRSIAGSRDGRRMLHSFVVLEMMLAVILLTGAGLLIRSLRNVLSVGPGFDPEQLIAADVSLASDQASDSQGILSFDQRLMDSMRDLPDVTSAGLTSNLPIGGTSWGTVFSIEGRPASASDFLASDQRIVSSGYFETMRIPLVSGRLFATHDTAAAMPVAVINDALARWYFPGENPVGRY